MRNECHGEVIKVFGQVFSILAGVLFPSIAYHARARVGETKNDNIIGFLDGIYKKLGQWHYFKDSNDFPKKRLVIS